MKKTKWFLYTVLVGLIPFFARLCIFVTLKNKDIYLLLDSLDFTVLGLVISITNINELEGNTSIEKEWKTIYIGFSIIYIVLYTIFFGISIFSGISKNIFDKQSILISTIFLSITSVIFGYAIFDKLNKSEINFIENELERGVKWI